MQTTTIPITITLLGDQSVGKTAIETRFRDNTFYPNGTYDPTTEKKQPKKLTTDNITYAINTIDTLSNVKHPAMRTLQLRSSNAIIIIYSITSESSFLSLEAYIAQIYKEREIEKGEWGSIMIVGNKCDEEDKREVSYERGKAYAEVNGFKFMEVSAKDDVNVEEMFVEAISVADFGAFEDGGRKGNCCVM